ncbi:hypothetical protein [Micromonospora sp. NPDC005220]|uniref:hypothetical protein n=1 Tax=Micromonospora sp. NPDC005220 TaxID=3155589 RepID=UPI0033AD936A
MAVAAGAGPVSLEATSSCSRAASVAGTELKTDETVLGSAEVVNKNLSSGAHLRDGLPRLYRRIARKIAQGRTPRAPGQ